MPYLPNIYSSLDNSTFGLLNLFVFRDGLTCLIELLFLIFFNIVDCITLKRNLEKDISEKVKLIPVGLRSIKERFTWKSAVVRWDSNCQFVCYCVCCTLYLNIYWKPDNVLKWAKINIVFTFKLSLEKHGYQTTSTGLRSEYSYDYYNPQWIEELTN